MFHNNNNFYGLDPNSPEFNDIINTACHYVGGREQMGAAIRGSMPGSRTQISDSITVVLAMGQAAMDLKQPTFALGLVRSFMGALADHLDCMDATEQRDIEMLFLNSLMASDPAGAAKLGLTPEFLAEYANSKPNHDTENL